MRKTVLPISVLLFTTLILYFAAGQQGILVPVRAGLEGFSDFTIGFFGTAYALGFIAGCYLIPVALTRVGHIRTFGVVAALAAVGMLAKGLLVYPEVWFVLRVVAGFAIAGAAMIIESWLNERATNENRGRVFSTYMIVYLTAVTAGQMSLVAFDPLQITMFVVAGILFILALIPTSLTLLPAPLPPGRTVLNLSRLYTLSPVGAWGAFAVGLANGAFGTLGPVYAQTIGFSTTGVAIFMSLALVAGACAQLPFGRLSDAIDRRRVIGGVSAIGAVAGIAMVMFASPGLVGYALVVGFGISAFSLYGLVVAHTNDHADPTEFVLVSGGLLLVFGIGSAVGPLIAAALITFGLQAGVFVFTALIHTLLGGYAVYRISQRKQVPDEEKDVFVATARPTSPGAAMMDPRFDDPDADAHVEEPGDPMPPGGRVSGGDAG
ncbi:MFS transporter [Pyruvatibacter sp.]|uniref:MFS transporter n=1 Tax=Pyruvatibacter sp. TaxID=1981328 RepID=UPI0032EDBE9E